MNPLDLMALTPVAPEHVAPFRFDLDVAMMRAYRAALYHWQ